MLPTDQWPGHPNVVQLLGVIVALIGSWVGVSVAYKALKHSQSHVDIQRELFRLQYFKGLRKWAGKAVNLISESASLCE